MTEFHKTLVYRLIMIACGVIACAHGFAQQGHMLWRIGDIDGAASEFALYPNKYQEFVTQGYGHDNHYHLVGTDDDHQFPYVLMGPLATHIWAGYMLHRLPIAFRLQSVDQKAEYELEIALLDNSANPHMRLRAEVNGHVHELGLPVGNPGDPDAQVAAKQTRSKLRFSIAGKELVNGVNEVTLQVFQGRWVMFDGLAFSGPRSTVFSPIGDSPIVSVKAAGYETETLVRGKRVQPLLLDIRHFNEDTIIDIDIDGKRQRRKVTAEHAVLEIPMARTDRQRDSQIKIFHAGKLILADEVTRGPQPLVTPIDYVNQFAGSSGSRWMIGPGPWMPFGMAKIMPDNENQRWKAGYEYQIENIAGFSHIHEWTMTGLLTMPTTGPLHLQPGPENDPTMGYRSYIDKQTEEAKVGYYGVDLLDYGIKAELTATTRATMQRYTFPQSTDARVLIDLFNPGEYSSTLKEAKVFKVSDTELEGWVRLINKHTDYHGVQDYTLHFVIQVDKPFKSMNAWIQDMIFTDVDSLSKHYRPPFTFYPLENVEEVMGDAGVFLEFDTDAGEQVIMRTGISLVSTANARLNLTKEMVEPFGWDFERIVDNQRAVWNALLDRVEIRTDDYLQKEKFYTNVYRALSPRTTWNDINGEWVDMDEQVQQMSDSTKAMYGSDAYWGLHWNLNQFYNLLYPEYMSNWLNTFQEMYEKGGWLPIGNPGLEYIRVMIGAPVVPMIVSAYQHGIRDANIGKLAEAIYHQQTANPVTYPGGGRVGNESYPDYLRLGYVPLYPDLHQFDSLNYQSYVSNTMEYAFQDYSAAQFFKALGDTAKYRQFLQRSGNWRNTFDKKTGYTRPRNLNGSWFAPFDPHRAPGYCEGSAWQFTWYVPQDPNGLIDLMGEDRFIERLNEGFEISEKAYFSSEFGYSPINHGNQTSMQSAYLFNYTKKPWLTQKWVRAIQEKYYGTGPRDAYPGDEDQGQMSAWYVMSVLGLFQMNGGTDVDPVFELGSPRFEYAAIQLNDRYYSGKQLVIEAKNASKTNCYIQSARLNGKRLTTPFIRWSQLKQGGKLDLVMGDKANMLLFN